MQLIPIFSSFRLYTVFFIQIVERFAFYILQIYLTFHCLAAVSNGGLGWNRTEALQLHGFYFGAAHLMPLLGGWISDRILGSKRSVAIGLVFYTAGFFFLLHTTTFYLGLLFHAMGYGLFKPCIINIIGNLYEKDDPRYEQIFTFSYACITLGIFFAGLLGGWMQGEESMIPLFRVSFFIAAANTILYLLIYRSVKEPNRKESAHTIVEPLTAQEKRQTVFLCLIALFAIVFYAAHQGGGNLSTLYLKEHTIRTINGYTFPIGWILSIGVLLTFILSISFGILWKKMAEKKTSVPALTKMILGFFATAIAFAFLLPAWHMRVDPLFQMAINYYIGFNIAFSFSKVCINPTMWSLFNSLAPKQHQAFYVGTSFVCLSIGNLVYAGLSRYFDVLQYDGCFAIFAASSFLSALTLFFLRAQLNKLLPKPEL